MNGDRGSVGETPAGATETAVLPQGSGPEGFKSFASKFIDTPIILWYIPPSDANSECG